MRGRENQSFHLRTETLIIVVRDANDYFKKGLGPECLGVVCMWLVPPRSTDVLRESTRRVKTSSSHCCAVSPGPEGMRRMGGRTQQIISILQAPFCLGLKTRWREEPITKSSVVGGEQCPVTPLWSSWRWWRQRELHTMASLMAKTTHSHLSYNDGRSEAAHGSLDWKWALLSHPSFFFFNFPHSCWFSFSRSILFSNSALYYVCQKSWFAPSVVHVCKYYTYVCMYLYSESGKRQLVNV